MYRTADRQERAWVRLAFIVPALPAVILAGAAFVVTARGQIDGRLLDLMMRGIEPLTRALVVGLLAAVLVALAGIGLAALTLRAWLHSRRLVVLALCVLLPLAVTPLLLGAASFAFLWRTPYAEMLTALPYIANRGVATVVAIDLIAQIVRYAPLATWLLVIVILQTDTTFRSYSEHSGISAHAMMYGEFLRPWIVPTLVVAAFAYQDAFNDYIITYLALKPSVATQTELVSHFLSRTFVSLAISRSANDASAVLLGISLLSSVISAFVFGLVVMVMLLAIRATRTRGSQLDKTTYPTSGKKPPTGGDYQQSSGLGWLPIVTSAALVLCLSASLITTDKASVGSVLELSFTLFVSLGVAVVCWGIAVLVNFLIRESRYQADGSVQRSFAKVAFASVSLGFVPPIGLAVAIYTVLFSFGNFDQTGARIGWFFAQVLRTSPLIVVLLIPSSLAIEDGNIWYLRVNGVRFFARLKTIFIAPFRATHFAILLISWNFVFNESIISSVFQSDIPAFSDIVQRASSGRSAAYPLAGLLVGLEALLFGALCIGWGLQVYRSWAADNATA